MRVTVSRADVGPKTIRSGSDPRWWPRYYFSTFEDNIILLPTIYLRTPLLKRIWSAYNLQYIGPDILKLFCGILKVKSIMFCGTRGHLLRGSTHSSCFSTSSRHLLYSDTLVNLKIGKHTRVIFQGFTGTYLHRGEFYVRLSADKMHD